MPCLLTSTHSPPRSVLVLPQGKSNSPPLRAILHSHNYPQTPPNATSSQPSRTPLLALVSSVMLTSPSSSPSLPSLCLTIRTRSYSPVEVNVQVPNYGASIYSHNTSLTPPLVPPRLYLKSSAPTISQSLRSHLLHLDRRPQRRQLLHLS